MKAAAQTTLMTVGAALSHAKLNLKTARLDAELLLAHILSTSLGHLWAYPERPLTPEQWARYQHLLAQRGKGTPLPYLTGRIEFYGLEFAIDPCVLIPRPETETLVDLALDWVSSTPANDLSLADVGTGSGCIAIALAHTWRDQDGPDIYALDISLDALSIARTNAQRHSLANRIRFLQADILSALSGRLDLIVSNPPYIANDDKLPKSIRDYEPRLALAGGADGLDVIRRLLAQAPNRLRVGGALLVEIGATQGAAAKSLARTAFPQAHVSIQSDLAGRDRVLLVQT